jgi:hypothetical protein
MIMNDLAEFTDLLTTLSVVYRTPLSSKSIELYWRVLQKFEFAEVKAAFQAHLTDPDAGQFMPKPADLIRCLKGDRKTQALQAWSTVAEGIRSMGGYASVVFDDPMIHAVIEDMGGWISLCQTLLKDFPFRANEFETRYAAYVLHPPLRYPKQLTGLEEMQNQISGHPIKPPLLMGDPQRALAVLQQGSNKSLHVHTLPAAVSLTQHDSLSEETS